MVLNDTLDIADEILSRFTFGWTDYSLFVILLIVSVLIGIYFGFFSRQDSTTEYLLAGKTMGAFPVAMSIVASHVSGITLLGIPTEVYEYGSQYIAIVITSLATCLATIYLFLPVFYKLQLTSTFEYLELRFAKPVRNLCSILFVLSLFIYIPIVVYVPALAFSQVSKLNLHFITPVLCTVCILYTSIGGLKAVVWTDTIQFSVTVGGLFAILYLGLKSVGGMAEVWRISDEGGRLVFFNVDPSPFVRVSFWGITISTTFNWLGHTGVNQGAIQRFLSVPKEAQAKTAIILSGIGFILVNVASILTGLIIYSKYADCDPLESKLISASDQLLPHYVMDVAGHIPGLPGLFLAGLVSAALATMSASLNTVSGIIYEDFLQDWLSHSPDDERKAAFIMKIIVVIVGLISIAIVFIVEKLGTIFQIAVSMRSVTDGPLVGLFILGMMVPWANAKGAVIGGYTSLFSLMVLVGGAQYYNVKKHSERLPTSIEGCPYPLNETISLFTTNSTDPTTLHEDPFFPFRISFMHFTIIGTTIVVVVGLIASYFCGEIDLEQVDPDHITPCMRRFLPEKKYRSVPLKDVAASNYVNKFEKQESDKLEKVNVK
ncbi:sodium-coupled monocarboxylate transporter 1-like [Prorops nasuta]|uniref:sodium-coupled monocarboxylate transporter 1-like n=1 Tax=Prorops nasuta TaxID=863751 RepID=UPI0034CF168F